MSAPKEAALAMLPFFPRDFLSSSRGMTLAERGAFLDLLWYQWVSDAPIPTDTARVARMLGVTREEFLAVWPAIQDRFVENEDRSGLINRRLERERTKSISMRKEAARRARLGGKTTKERWEKDPQGMAASLAASKAASLAASSLAQARLDEGSISVSASESTINNPNPKRASSQKDKKPTDGIAKARKQIAANPDFTDDEIAKVTHVSLEEVKVARTH